MNVQRIRDPVERDPVERDPVERDPVDSFPTSACATIHLLRLKGRTNGLDQNYLQNTHTHTNHTYAY